MQNTLRRSRADYGEHGISQRDLAKLAKIHPDRYWRIEKNYIDPTDNEIEALERVLGVSRDVLFPLLAERQAVVR